MNFSYETQGAITFLVCELEPTDMLDTLALGMLTTNHIQGLAPVIYTEMNGQRYLKYNISAKVTADRFFGGNINKQRLVTAFQNILNAVCCADEYMLDPACFSLIPEHVYLNVSNCEAALICIPVAIDGDINSSAVTFFSNMIDIGSFAPNENRNYIDQIKNALSDADMFNLYNFRDLMFNLDQAPAASFNPAMNNVGLNGMQFGSQPGVASPVSAYDSTITINEAPELNNMAPNVFGGMQTPPAPPAPPVMQNIAPPPPVTPQRPNIPQPPAPSFAGNSMQQPVIPQPVVPQTSAPQSGMRQSAPQQPAIPVPPSRNQGFAIPGQSAAKVEEPASKKKNKKNKKEAQPEAPVAQDGEKKITFLGLLTKYNKENAALYKAQKEAEKQAKAENAEKEKQAKQAAKNANNTQAPAAPASNVPVQQNTPAPNMMGMGFGGGVAPAGGMQPLPVQNSFNETTVLSAFTGGETTVLSSNPMVAEPALFRIKTGERIVINKPVFRIGKEKSYVDYFIGDNTAISRSHCNIYTENGEYFVEDTNSTNHTYVNGAIITGNTKVKITSGDKIRLANEDFTFSV